jgi:hypothetical protein
MAIPLSELDGFDCRFRDDAFVGNQGPIDV